MSIASIRPVASGVVWGLAASLLMGLASPVAAAPADERLNVILISLDTVRPDHLSCYGYQRHTTPHLDEIAQEGILFTQAFSQAPNTFPSHLSIFTSRYPTQQWASWEAADLQPSTETLTERLKQEGYQLARFVDFWHPNFRSMLASRAFQPFDEVVSEVKLRALPEELFDWLQAHRGEPFFLFLHGFDAHGSHVLPIRYDAKRFNPTYQGRWPSTKVELKALVRAAYPEIDDWKQLPKTERVTRGGQLYWKLLGELRGPAEQPRQEERDHLKALYDAQLYYLDQGLAHLFNALKNLDLMERTLLVIVSDHGQAFGEHGWYASHEQCYEEVTRIVLLIRDPRLTRRGRQVHQLVQGIDVMPTILELLDLPIPESAQGRSLVPLLRTGHDPGREEVAVSVGKGIRAVRTPRWMLLVKEGVPTELYDRRADPNEQHNLLARHPDLVARLQERLDAVVGKEHAGEHMNPEQWMQQRSYW